MTLGISQLKKKKIVPQEQFYEKHYISTIFTKTII